MLIGLAIGCATGFTPNTYAQSITDFSPRLLEEPTWLAKPLAGPKKSKGIIYFIRGGNKQGPRDDFNIGPYFLKTLSENGWDIIQAQHPHEYVLQKLGNSMRMRPVIRAAIPLVRQRIRQLKAEGYKRIILAAHGTGNAIAVNASLKVAPDALILLNPTFGPKYMPTRRNRLNPNHKKRIPFLEAMISRVRVPTLLIVTRDKLEFTPLAFIKIAARHFRANEVPHVIIGDPQIFEGHHSYWLPSFDYIFGVCIQSFVNLPLTQACTIPLFSENDFRAIGNIKQIADVKARIVTSAKSLIGKQFVVYPQGKPVIYLNHLSATRRTKIQFDEKSDETYAFRKGQICVNGNCSRMIRWDKQKFLEFDARTGALKAQWIER